ncbi:MAG: hypothetical protein M1812_004766 [Candelaria pacifica]|nr:MAG: hypothetical protein M1812_004766 [Candelaria pacifica]
MKISQLYVYPIKSLRACPINSAELTPQGFAQDRRFMLLKVHRDDPSNPSSRRLENMHVTFFPEMTLFLTSLDLDAGSSGTITVTYDASNPCAGSHQTLQVPLLPDVSQLKKLEVMMHQSPTKAYEMPAKFNDWFSACLGYRVILAYIGESRRPVLGTLSPNRIRSQGWLLSIKSTISRTAKAEDGITFSDCAPLLIATETSLADVSARLPEGELMDMTKFRPNIVLQGSAEAYEEDFWGQLRVKDNIDLILTHNCVRCKSINIDYATGKPGTGESGQVLKKLMKDRRVDTGTKYSPVFGRYGFLGMGTSGRAVAIGDNAIVTKRNLEKTKFGRGLEILGRVID